MPPFLAGPICASAVLSEYFWCLASWRAPARLSPSSCSHSCSERPSEMFLKTPHIHYFSTAVKEAMQKGKKTVHILIILFTNTNIFNKTQAFNQYSDSLLVCDCNDRLSTLISLLLSFFLKALSCQYVVIPACVLRLSSSQPVMPVIHRDQKSSWWNPC